MNTTGRTADVKVGLFMIGALSILITGSLWVAGSTFLSGDQTRYRVLMKSAGGIRSGDRVRVAGVDVGTVDGIHLQGTGPWPVVATVAVDPDIAFHTDSSARLTSSGVLGATYLELNPGSEGASPLPPGGEIQSTPVFGLDDVMSRVDELAARSLALLTEMTVVLDRVSVRVDPMLARLEGLLSEENTRHIHGILANIQETLDDTRPRIGSLLDHLDAVAARAEEGTEDLPELIEQVSAIMADIQVILGPDGNRLAGLLDAAEGSMKGAGSLMDVIASNSGEIDSTLRDLRDTAANLAKLSQTLKERPYSLVRIKPLPERKPGDGVGGSKR
jgi:phospholipid/cholesterol/gamma-HCH transport system substrate-binding protein